MTDLSLLTDAAIAAGDIALRHFGNAPKTWDKGDGAGPVTEADLAVNAYLLDHFRAARPAYGWLSEETEDATARLDSTETFIIDPIDGTRAFIEGSRDWAISIAVTTNGTPTAAAVYMPARDTLYAAAIGMGATRNGAAIHVSTQSDLKQATVLTAKPNLDPHHWRAGTPPQFNKTFRSSLAYRLALVAEGRFDAMLTLRPTWEWDIAAGALLVTEAGGAISDRNTQQLRFNNPTPQLSGIVAAGPTHRAIVTQLAPQPTPPTS